MTPTRVLLVCASACVASCSAAQQIGLTYHGKPYDLVKANWMGANYLQALINPRWEAVAFAHNRFGDAEGVGGLYFIDDQGRVIWSFAAEAEYGPVARVQAVATMARGILRARIPHSHGRYFFVIDGRQAQYLRPHGERIGAYWLQDTSTPFCTVEATSVGGQAPLDAPEVERLPEVMAARTVYHGTLGPAAVTLTSRTSVQDIAPGMEITAPEPSALSLTIRPTQGCHFIHAGKRGRLTPQEASKAQGSSWFLLEREAKLATSDKTGWEAPAVWGQLNSMVLVACDPPPDQVRPGGREGWQELQFTWRRAGTVRLRFGRFSELDPADCEFVFQAAERVARDGHFGCKPYLPVRTSTGFMGSLAGLAAAAWLLQEYQHPEAATVKDAALEAMAAVIDGERRGYYGTYQWNALRAAYYLRKVAPDRFAYGRWAQVWADRYLSRCPPGWKTPPWSDTALRAIQSWRCAWLITGDEKYRQAMDEGMLQFSLSDDRPIEGFMMNGQARPFDGYDCTGANMLLGEWGHRGDARAQTMVAQAADKYFCDLGFIPYRTWTCDDLLPYYVGYSLPGVYPKRQGLGRPVALALDEYVAYDHAGVVTRLPRPGIPTPP